MSKRLEVEPGNLVVIRNEFNGCVEYADLVTSWPDEFGFVETMDLKSMLRRNKVRWDNSSWVEVY
jgi:hypothetical protein